MNKPRIVNSQNGREGVSRGAVFLFAASIDGGRVRSYCAGWKTLPPEKGDGHTT